MKALRVILAAGALTAIAGSALAADEQVVKESGSTFPSYLDPVSVRAEVGTTGYGGAISYRVNPYVGLTLGYNGGDISWSDDVKIDGTKYDLDMENNNTYLNAELYPWGASENAFARSLYVAAGVAYLDNDYDLQKRTSAGRTLSINNNDYEVVDASKDGGVTGKMSYKNDIAPYVGFGLNAPVYKNIGVFGEVGAYYTGNPDVKLDAYNLKAVTGAKPIDQAVADEQDKIANKGSYEWMPVGKVGVSFKF
ncbi:MULTISPECIES: ornithine uptake porin CarO [Acinetobacter]|uniref:ornithine uptake porin CarO n=1 Tax=Acinetobacter TaxID=469 RepID=UPI000F66ACC4|nr:MULTISPECIES: ornithine uptake porin CarO [Acinetobacter]MBF4455405.1 ornithine uptake porin CarO [Acinetobacter sp. SK-43]MDH0666727.1 ornithine uptake porin CarO [Acinetobacter junii]MDH1689562.1 ornithine uptake porin CarO [Acinetobacter junii]MDI9721385.1 ornithine uptake porin CarO [Acinetobacter junii]MDU2409266.1 ornithine uptake porin CarO [Acinetobacter junii]